MKEDVVVFWFRRDLRWFDNHGLFHALNSGYPVLPVFIFDTNILEDLPKNDARLTFIYQELQRMIDQIEGKSFFTIHHTPEEAWNVLIRSFNIKAVYYNHDYEPYAKERDEKITQQLSVNGIKFFSFKDQVIYEKDEIMTSSAKPYTVFTPYKNRWLEKWNQNQVKNYHSEDHLSQLLNGDVKLPSLTSIGFNKVLSDFPDRKVNDSILNQYAKTRDYPAKSSTSRLGVHLRFGTISIRELAIRAAEKSEMFLNELIWREFYQMTLHHFPHVVNRAFKPKYDLIPWDDNSENFEKWCAGMTGYPLVDAGMRELSNTGYMHNRVRMVTASFLTKHLLQDWKKGEAWFAEKLLDYELASNNGGWQWAAGSGCDAAPYFRIFNPEIQLKKFDPEFTYVKKWIPEFGTDKYPKPIVEHSFARKRALAVFKKALN